jgi:hypothetical protein
MPVSGTAFLLLEPRGRAASQGGVREDWREGAKAELARHGAAGLRASNQSALNLPNIDSIDGLKRKGRMHDSNKQSGTE